MNKTRAFASSAGLTLIRDNPMNPGAGMAAYITAAYATGFQIGDIRRCLLSDVNVGATSGNVLAAADSDFSSDTGFWSKDVGVTISGGTANWAGVTTNFALFKPTGFPYIPGAAYTITFTISSYTAGGVRPVIGGTFGTTRSAAGTYTETLVAGGAGQSTGLYANGSTTLSCDNLVIADAVVDRSYKNKPAAIFGTLTRSQVGVGSQLVAYSGWSAANYLQETSPSTDLDPSTGALFVPFFFTIPTNVAAAGWAFDRSAASGAGYKLGHDATGKLTASITDGTTTRTATTAAAYNTGTVISGALLYEASGAVTIIVNGERVASTVGTPLGSLSNASATLTVGIDRGLTAPWAGGLALMHFGMTAPTDDAARFKYQQERAMFRDGAQVTLPDSGACVDLDYDPQTDCWRVASAANESEFHGLVRTASTPAAAGSISKISGRHGMKAVSRTTTNPGVDITMPSQNLKEDLIRRGEQAAADRARGDEMFDWAGGFTGNLTSGLNTITSVSGISIPAAATIKGAQISHANLPAGTTIIDQVGTTLYLSANATGTAAGAAIAFLDFIYPAGIEARRQTAAGLTKQEGSTKDYTRQFDGFRERARYGTAPGAAVAVLGNGRRFLS